MSQSIEEILDEAIRLVRHGELTSAAERCEEVLAAEPDHGKALNLRGALACQLGDLAVAAELLGRAAELNPDDAACHGNLGNALRAAGQVAEAIESYQRALQLAPDSSATLYNLASALRHNGRLSEAVRCYQRALEIEPECAATWNNLGIALKEQGRAEEAVSAYRRALEIEPSPQIHSNLGNALWDCQLSDEAVDAFNSALALDPGCVEASFNLHAVLCSQREDLEAPARALGQALEASSNHAKTLFYLAVIRELQGRVGEAGELFAKLAAEHPDAAEFMLSSWRYAREVIAEQGALLLAGTFDVLAHALAQAQLPGLVVELGVRFGRSVRFIASGCDQTVHGFDSFEGLPEAWGSNPRGLYTTEGVLPEVPANVQLHVGWFEDTLPGFVASHPGPLRLANIDCDLYSSTAAGLSALAQKIVPGTVLVFDEYLCNPGWRDEEYRAFQEAVRHHGWSYRYLALSLLSKQAVVRIC